MLHGITITASLRVHSLTPGFITDRLDFGWEQSQVLEIVIKVGSKINQEVQWYN